MKQDRINPRTAADLQRKYGRKVANTAVVAEDAAKEATQAAASAESAAKSAAVAAKDITELEAKLELTLKVDENGNVISEINGVANVIKFLANSISIQSDNFTLAEDGTVTAKGISVDGGKVVLKMSDGNIVRIGDSWNQLVVESSDYDPDSDSGYLLGISPSLVNFVSGAGGASTPMQFNYADGEFLFTLSKEWNVSGISGVDNAMHYINILDKLVELEARLAALEE